jgi:hypothetical protein
MPRASEIASVSTPGRRSWLMGGLTAGVIVGSVLTRPGSRSLLACPFHAATGLDCPTCGLTRSMLALVHGDVASAFGHNVLWPVVPTVAIGMLWRSTTADAPAHPERGLRWRVAFVVVVGAFWVLRNMNGPLEVLAAS